MPRTKADPQQVADLLHAQAIPDLEGALGSVDRILEQELSAGVVRNLIGGKKELVKGLGSLRAALAAALVEAQEGQD